jgi:hypothetical protein
MPGRGGAPPSRWSDWSGHLQTGTVWPSTWLASNSAGSLPGGHRVLNRWRPEHPPVGCDPPARFCWALPGWHSVSDRWDATSCRAGGCLPAGICWALQAGTVCLTAAGELPGRTAGGPPAGICWVPPGGHSVLDRNVVAPAEAVISASEEGQRVSLRAWSPGGPSAGHSDASCRSGVLTRRGPVSRVAPWQDSDRVSESPDSPPRLGNRTAAGGGCCRGGGGPGALDGPGLSLHGSARSEQVPPGPCTDAFLHPWRAGRAIPAIPAGFYTLTQNQYSWHGNTVVSPACAAPCDSFSALLLKFFKRERETERERETKKETEK